MGDCGCYRLFCVVKKIFLQYLSDGNSYRFSMPGMWTYKSRTCSSQTGFCRSVEDASLHLSDYASDCSVFFESVFFTRQKKQGASKSGNGCIDSDDCLLCVADVSVFSRGTADELLQG